MRPSGESASESLWRTASWPALALLGLVLPLAFLPQIEDYLYYFRPPELVPAYGTAWLFLAVVVAPLAGVLAALLALVARAPRARHTWAALIIGGGGAAAAGALLYSALQWLQSFGWLSHWSLRGQLLWPALALGAWLAASRQGRARFASLRRIAWAGTLIGAGAAAVVPFSGWTTRSHDLQPASVRLRALAAPGARNAPPHVVLLTIDALSAEHMSLYGATRPTTPMLSAFAAQATAFDRAYANANFTTPGVASILTGTRPWIHRALQLPSWPDTDARRASLPALLQAAGYQTAYVSTNAAAGADKNGLGQYFDFASRDRIRDVSLCTDTLSRLFKYVCPVASMPLFSQVTAWIDEARGGPDAAHYDPRLALDPALAWLARSDRSRPVFLWVHLFPPHSPYAAPAPWLGLFDSSADARRIGDSEPHWGYELSRVSDQRVRVLAARYDESVAYVDYYAGQFLQRALQLLGNNTVVIVTADHGESFGHGYGAHTGPGLFDEIIRVPLIIKLPGQTEGLHSNVTAEQVDIAPTVTQLAGISAPALWEGRSLLDAWAPPPTDDSPSGSPDKLAFSMSFEQNARFAQLSNGVIAVIAGRWKLVHYLGRLHYPQMPPAQDALFDLATDPSERTNLAAKQPALVVALREQIEAQLAQHGGRIDGTLQPELGNSAPENALNGGGSSAPATAPHSGYGF